ncbi:MAG TPA: PLD nuclease N-terminal domain-containing protein [Capillimicrobium sp.]|nr:PLD nuclease N-terminal domain-containing protein [Capillimicrobium sp.]
MDQPAKKQWSDLSPGQRAAIVGAGIVQVGLLVAALVDIRRRPAKQINGPKGAWVAASFVNYAGPLAYFAFGRKR